MTTKLTTVCTCGHSYDCHGYDNPGGMCKWGALTENTCECKKYEPATATPAAHALRAELDSDK